jgi:hypothetical protein
MTNCLKSIKSCLNSIKQNKDYEYVSYEQQQTPEIKRNMSIEYNQIETIEPKFQSTRIIIDNNNSLYFLPPTAATCNKISSTMINENKTNNNDSLVTNDLTTSKIESNYNSVFTSDQSSCNSSYYSDQDTLFNNKSHQSFSYDSNQFHSVNLSSFFDKQDNNENEIFVCTIPNKYKFQGDLNLNYSDRVKLIHSNTDYCLVQNILTNQCGYVPKNSIILLSNFLKQF